LDQPQRVEQMSAEHVGAAAVIGQRCERFERLVLALAAAKIALQAPERGDDRGRHAEVLVFARKYRLVLFHLCGAIGQTSACEHLVGHLQEILRKESLPRSMLMMRWSSTR